MADDVIKIQKFQASVIEFAKYVHSQLRDTCWELDQIMKKLNPDAIEKDFNYQYAQSQILKVKNFAMTLIELDRKMKREALKNKAPDEEASDKVE
jgi:hypothetical protein